MWCVLQKLHVSSAGHEDANQLALNTLHGVVLAWNLKTCCTQASFPKL